jgi:hypothetical protein
MTPIFLAARTLPFKADPEKSYAELNGVMHQLTNQNTEKKERSLYMMESKVPGNRSPAQVDAGSPWSDWDMRKIYKHVAAVNQTVIFEVYHLTNLDGDYSLQQFVRHPEGQSSHELVTNPGAFGEIKVSDEAYLQQLANWYRWLKPEGEEVMPPSQVVIRALTKRWHTLSKIVHPVIEQIAPFAFDQ